MKVGLYGGTFDPIHRGHIESVRRAKSSLDLDRVLFLPTAQPPHKLGRRMAPALARYVMVEMALIDEPDFFVSSEEMDREKPSYTVETLERLRQKLPRAELYLLIGSDSFLKLSSWYRWRELAELAILGILPRPGAIPEPERLESPELRSWLESGKARVVSDPPNLSISSSGIRQAITQGKSSTVADQVPKQVLDYIVKYDFYRET